MAKRQKDDYLAGYDNPLASVDNPYLQAIYDQLQNAADYSRRSGDMERLWSPAQEFSSAFVGGYGPQVRAMLRTRSLPAEDNRAYQAELAKMRLAQQTYRERNPLAAEAADWAGIGIGSYLPVGLGMRAAGRAIPAARAMMRMEEALPSEAPLMIEGPTAGGYGVPAVQQGRQVAVYERPGVPAVRQGEWQGPYGAYGEYRDVTGDLLTRPQSAPQLPSRGPQVALRYEPVPQPPRMAQPMSPWMATGMGGASMAANMAAMQGASPQAPFNSYGYDVGPYGGGGGAASQAPMMSMGQGGQMGAPLPPMSMMAPNAFGNLEAEDFGSTPLAAAPKVSKVSRTQRSKSKAAKSSESATAQPNAAWQGNLNYHVTRALDALFGQNEAERGRQAQQYYEQYPQNFRAF